MNGIEVTYIDHMGDDLRHVNAARSSFDRWKESYDEKDRRLIDYLVRNKETEPMRHIQFTLQCKAPIALARQLQKHQIGMAWSEVSRRYVTKGPKFHIPRKWRGAPIGNKKQGSDGFLPKFKNTIASHIYYSSIMKASFTYNTLLKLGAAPEQARLVLPQSMITTWVWTGSLQAWAHLCNLRLDSKAQAEANYFAQQVEDIIYTLVPDTWKSIVSV